MFRQPRLQKKRKNKFWFLSVFAVCVYVCVCIHMFSFGTALFVSAFALIQNSENSRRTSSFVDRLGN